MSAAPTSFGAGLSHRAAKTAPSGPVDAIDILRAGALVVQLAGPLAQRLLDALAKIPAERQAAALGFVCLGLEARVAQRNLAQPEGRAVDAALTAAADPVPALRQEALL